MNLHFQVAKHDSEQRIIQSLNVLSARQEEREKLINEYQRRSDQAFAPSTRRSRAVCMRIIESYLHRQGITSRPPFCPFVVARMIDDFALKYSVGTIEVLLSAITELHRANFLPSPRLHPIVQLAFVTARKNYGKAPKQAPPLCRAEILSAIRKMGDTKIEIRDKAVLLVASDSWCRSSELAALIVSDMEVQGDGSGLLRIRRSKTDPFSRGGYAYLSPEAVTAVGKWQRLAKLRPTDPMFVTSYNNGCKKALLSVTFTQILRRATGRKDVSSHSTRVGGVHDAMRIGCNMASIILAGRWKSAEMPARYGERFLVGQSAAAKVAAQFRDSIET